MKKITIIGAGIAGLAASIALRQKGFDVEILERTKALKEAGAGVQISPNGIKVINALGVELKGEFAPETVVMRKGETGKDVFTIPMRGFAKKRWGEEFYNIHRSDFQESLLERARALEVTIRLGQRISHGAFIALQNEAKAKGNIIVGADGVHSIARERLYPNLQAHFSKRVAYRAMVPLEKLTSPPAPSAVIWAGKRKHAVTTRVRYGNLVNFVGVCQENEWQEEGWNHAVNPEIVRKIFNRWHPSIYEILKNVESMNRWALLFHPTPTSLFRDNVVLIGDAAHPMLPSFAQGAVQALEDAYILAECLAHGELEDFNKLRLKRIAKVQHKSKVNMRHYHYGPIMRFAYYNGAWVLDKLLPELLYRELDWLYGYDPIKAARSYF